MQSQGRPWLMPFWLKWRAVRRWNKASSVKYYEACRDKARPQTWCSQIFHPQYLRPRDIPIHNMNIIIGDLASYFLQCCLTCVFLRLVLLAVNKLLGKPTQYIMASLAHAAMRHNGSGELSANVCLNSIGGINSRNNNKFCAEVSALCQKHLGVPADRV